MKKYGVFNTDELRTIQTAFDQACNCLDRQCGGMLPGCRELVATKVFGHFTCGVVTVPELVMATVASSIRHCPDSGSAGFTQAV